MKKLMYIAAAAMMLIMVGCNREAARDSAPHWSENHPVVVDPQWQVDESMVDITSSMNIIAAPNMSIQKNDRLAAMCGGQILGVCQPVETKFGLRFFLCVYRSAQRKGAITLAYYSSKEQSVRYWVEVLTFTHDAVIGLASEPYSLTVEYTQSGPYVAQLNYSLPDIKRHSKDELALFCGSECRKLLPVVDGEGSATIPMQAESEQVYIRYFSDKEARIYTSERVTITANQTTTIRLTE